MGPRRLHKELQKLRQVEAARGTPALISGLLLMYNLGLLQALFRDLCEVCGLGEGDVCRWHRSRPVPPCLASVLLAAV